MVQLLGVKARLQLRKCKSFPALKLASKNLCLKTRSKALQTIELMELGVIEGHTVSQIEILSRSIL